MDFSALDAIANIAREYKRLDKRLHLRFLKEEDHRHLAKGRDLLKDIESWRVCGMSSSFAPPKVILHLISLPCPSPAS